MRLGHVIYAAIILVSYPATVYIAFDVLRTFKMTSGITAGWWMLLALSAVTITCTALALEASCRAIFYVLWNKPFSDRKLPRLFLITMAISAALALTSAVLFSIDDDPFARNQVEAVRAERQAKLLEDLKTLGYSEEEALKKAVEWYQNPRNTEPPQPLMHQLVQ